MLLKTYELTGKALDWAFSKFYLKDHPSFKNTNHVLENLDKVYNFSEDSEIAMHVIKEYKISLMHVEDDDPMPIEDGPWTASMPGADYGCTGPTPEIAIYRCVVDYELGENIEIPDALLKV